MANCVSDWAISGNIRVNSVWYLSWLLARNLINLLYMLTLCYYFCLILLHQCSALVLYLCIKYFFPNLKLCLYVGCWLQVPSSPNPFPFRWSPTRFVYLGISTTPEFHQMFKANISPLFEIIKKDLCCVWSPSIYPGKRELHTWSLVCFIHWEWLPFYSL